MRAHLIETDNPYCRQKEINAAWEREGKPPSHQHQRRGNSHQKRPIQRGKRGQNRIAGIPYKTTASKWIIVSQLKSIVFL